MHVTFPGTFPGTFLPCMENSGLRGADTDGPGEGTDISRTSGRGASRNAFQVRRSKLGLIIKVPLGGPRRHGLVLGGRSILFLTIEVYR